MKTFPPFVIKYFNQMHEVSNSFHNHILSCTTFSTLMHIVDA